MKQLYVIGDSISIEYGPSLEAALSPGIAYARKEGLNEAMANLDIPTGANGGDSSMVLAFLKTLCADPAFQPDILAINAGLHDMKCAADGSHQIELDAYRANLSAMVSLCAERQTTMVWIRTTPIDDVMALRNPSFSRCQADVDRYNAVADEVMTGGAVPMLDLHGMTANLEIDEPILWRDHAHFHPSVYTAQGQWLAARISAILLADA